MPDENGGVQMALFSDLPPGGEIEKTTVEPEPGTVWELGEPELSDGSGLS